MRWTGAPEVATPRVMTLTAAVLYLIGGTAGMLATLGTEPGAPTRTPLFALAGGVLVASAIAFRFGRSWPREAFHIAITAATTVILVAVTLSPDPVTAVVIASLASFIAIDACFFSLRLAVAHVAAVLGTVTVALLLRGDIAVPTVLALGALVIGLSTITRALVMRASSASRDPLTGLANRRGFDQAMDEAMTAAARTGEPLSAALLDLDHFKALNDSEGHDAGDRVLQRVADVWRTALPAPAVLARHGGDEFALLLPGLTGPAALDAVRRVRAMHPDIALSCGVAEHRAGSSAAQLMRRADVALYDVKAAGRGGCRLESGAASDLATDLAAALHRGAVTVHVQPIVDLRAERVVGVEALARWTHPQRGPVRPDEFIAVAEQHGLMPRLGEHVFRTACTELAALHAATGRRLRVGINVSGRELSDPGYARRVRAALADTGWPAGETVIEVTESLLEAESSTAVATLHELRAQGFKVAIDDFGTGYSSLSRLDTLPLDVLKLDASFTATITSSPRRATMLRSVADMARGLGLDVVAEGVETAEQDAELRAAGCTFGQGWHFGRPGTLADVVAALESRAERTPALRG